MKTNFNKVLAGCLILIGQFTASAWDYGVHRKINELAITILPTNFPGFVCMPENVERIAFLSGEPDRWRNTPDLPLKHFNGPDHYIDVEDLDDYGLTLGNLPELRYDFIAELAAGRMNSPGSWAHLSDENNKDHTKELCGLLPWTISEYYSRLKSAFSYLRAFHEAGGTPEEIANARQNIIYLMGVMGHYVGDAAQPLHTTKHYNGWVGVNPEGYTTSRTIHGYIDGGYWKTAGLPEAKELESKLHIATLIQIDGKVAAPDQIFQTVLNFIQNQHARVEQLYRLEKSGGFNVETKSAEQGREFLTDQIAAAAQELANLWVSAWQQAPEDTFLINRLRER